MKLSEMLLWILGTTLLATYFSAHYWGEHQRREGLVSFAEPAQLAPAAWLPGVQGRVFVPAGLPAVVDPGTAQDTVIAMLRIPVIGLEVPVYQGTQGTSEPLLRRGGGLVEGTAILGGAGKVGIAAHRDTELRGLKDVAIGDLIELGTPEQTRVYRITTLEVVGPDDVHVSDGAGEPVLTLVTAYPFNFVGNAPQRFIVRATVARDFI